MGPWTVDAWIAFLKVFVDGLRALAWPVVAIAGLLLFRSAIRKALERIRKATPNSVEFAPLEQRVDEQGQDGLSLVLETKYGQLEEPLKPWLHRIRADIGNLDEANRANLNNLLIVALAQAQRRADFLDITHRIFGTQILLLSDLQKSGFVTEATIVAHYEHHVERAVGAPSELSNWIGFLTSYGLVRGDTHRL